MNPPRRHLQSAALLGLAALGATASAQTQSYVQKTKNVHAAVLLLDGDHPVGKSYGQTATPFAFYNLDQAARIKPTGWVFTNPYAPGTVTQDIINRYAEIPGAVLPTLSDRISKRQGAYWTVQLSKLSETQIADYDVLLLAPKYLLQLTSLERERLRRFVDGGGVLWVDTIGLFGSGSRGTDQQNNLPLAIFPGSGGGPRSLIYDRSSALIAGPKPMSDTDIYNLTDTNNTYNGIGGVIQATSANPPNLLAPSGEFARYRTVVIEASGTTTITPGQFPIIAQAPLGDGTIVVTARGAAEILNQGSAKLQLSYSTANQTTGTGGSNVGFQAQGGTQFNAQQAAAARLAINIASLGPNFRQPGGGAHNTASATTEPGSPVLTRFDAEGTYGPPGNTISGAPAGMPVTYKGYLVATVGNRVVVYDAVPGRDLDGDGDPDDGIVDSSGTPQDSYRDVSVGKSLDLVWVSGPLPSPLSAPTCASVPEASATGGVGGAFVDQILVTDSRGSLHAFPLVRYASNYRAIGGAYNEIPGYPITAPKNTSVGAPFPATVYDGIAYMASTVSPGSLSSQSGRVWAVDLARGQVMGGTAFPWTMDAAMTGRPLPPLTASATIGYIPASDSPGGVDRVLYAPGRFGSNNQPGFVSLWLGAKGETPANISVTGSTMSLTTHAAATSRLSAYFPLPSDPPSLRQLAPHLTILQNGVPVDASAYVTSGPSDGGNGILNYQVASGVTDATFSPGNLELRLDYTIDWGKAESENLTVERGRLILPIYKASLTSTTTKRILGPIALTPRGTLHMIEGTLGGYNKDESSDSYFAIREDLGVRGQFRVVARYTLYQKYTQTFAGSPVGTAVPAVLGDADAVQGFINSNYTNPSDPFNTFDQFVFAGGVALRNGIAFATINARRGGFLPVTMLAAFKAEPETPELRLGTSITAPRITQTDFGRSRPATIVATPTLTNLNSTQLVVDTENGVVRIENLATTTNNEITDCLSESQPIGVATSATGAYVFRQPDAFGDRWSPLLWFGLWEGGTSGDASGHPSVDGTAPIASGTPLVAGNSVFIPTKSELSDILAGTRMADWTFSGHLWSVDADAPTTGEFAVPLPDRPWIIQQVQLVQTNPTVNPRLVDASPYFRMPQNRGVADINDYTIRLKSTKLGNSQAVLGVGGGDGIVAAWTDTGVFGLSRADFLVCDEGRLLKVDSAGNPVSNAFSGKFSGIGNGGSASETRPLVRPVKAYPVGTNDTLVVDAGANRVMRIDEDGTVERSIDRMLVDRVHKPAAFRANEPLTLKDPRDVATWEGYVFRAASGPELLEGQVAGGYEYWIHYLVADSGNNRVLELVDRFQVDNQGRVGAPVTINEHDVESNLDLDVAQVGVLLWQSPSLEQAGKVGDYYNSVSRVYVGSTTTGTGRYVYVTGVSRTSPTRSAAGLDTPNVGPVPSGGGGGAVVVFDPVGGVRVMDRFSLPSLAGVPFFSATGPPTVGKFVANAQRVQQNERTFTGVQAVSARTILEKDARGNPVLVNGNPVSALSVMVTDADAVYEFVVPSTTLGDPSQTLANIPPSWMINQDAFTGIRGTFDPTNKTVFTLGNDPLLFRPAYARRLDSGDILLVNGYSGLMRDGITAYSGEVTLLSGSVFDYSRPNLGFDSGSIRFELPPLTGIRGLVSPVFADRR